jgi:membrane protease subunit HflC
MALKWIIGIAVLVIAGLIVLSQSFYVVGEGEQVVITQFGEPQKIVQSPGLYVKTPFIQEVVRFEKRVLTRDPAPSEYLTLDRKRVVVDAVARYRITDPLQFFRTVRDEAGIGPRLDDIAGGRLRQELAGRAFIPIVREERDDIMARVTEGVREAMTPFGIEVVDVLIKRLDLPTGVQDSVFERMRAERQRIAAGFRAEGEERAREIRATADRTAEVTIAGAVAQADRIRGEGDAAAIEITAAAFGRDLDFYQFQRRLAAYEELFTNGGTVILAPDSDLFRFFEGPNGRTIR